MLGPTDLSRLLRALTERSTAHFGGAWRVACELCLRSTPLSSGGPAVASGAFPAGLTCGAVASPGERATHPEELGVRCRKLGLGAGP